MMTVQMEQEGLSNEDRAIIHQLCQHFNLKSQSHGKPTSRILTISKKMEVQRHIANSDASCISLQPPQVELIDSLSSTKPITLAETVAHLTAGMKHANILSNGNEYRRSFKSEKFSKQVPPPSNSDPNMAHFRKTLPATAQKELILNTIKNNKVVLISGGTGCGKTTQVPQFLLEDACATNEPIKIICTQPRRLPAIAVAERVARERNEPIGATVGYHIRLEQKSSKSTILTYVTSGVLLRMLSSEKVGDDLTHVILDEIHERETNTDYLLIALKLAMKNRHKLKVILMSATMEGNLDTFLKYFGDTKVAHIDIPARLYQVEKIFLSKVLWLTGYKRENAEQRMFGNDQSEREQQRIPAPTSAYNPFATPKSNNPFVTPKSNDVFGSTFNAKDNLWNSFNEANDFDAFNPSMPPPNYGYFNSNQSHIRAYQTNHPVYDRTKAFDEKIYHLIKKTPIDEADIIDNYYKDLGVKDASVVDLELTLRVIQYCLLSKVEGAILVFLPGYEDINNLKEMIDTAFKTLPVDPIVYILHSQMNSDDQQKVFERNKYGTRKVILSTNIAEASVTIDDVVFVIDTGRVKEKNYDPGTRITQLKTVLISQSSSVQRLGRAGRCARGFCFRLYTKQDYNEMPPCQIAEMKRSAIHNVCLHAKMFAPVNMSVQQFLLLAPEPPLPLAISQSMSFLEELGAICSERKYTKKYFTNPQQYQATNEHILEVTDCQVEKEGDLTDLGRIMAELPVDPSLARLLLFGIGFKCFNPIITLVASMSHREPFILPLSIEKEKANASRDLFGKTDFSDHIMLIRAFYMFDDCSYRNQIMFCKRNFLNINTMRMISGIRKQLMVELRRFSLIPNNMTEFDDPRVNKYSNSWPMVQAVIVAGCYPGVGYTQLNGNIRKIKTDSKANVALHPGSILKRQVMDYNKQFVPQIEYLAFNEIAKIDQRLTVKTITAVPPISVLLFAGPLRLAQYNINLLMEEELDKIGAVHEDDRDLHPYNRKLMPNPFTDINGSIIQLESWLVFRGNRDTMKKVLQLKFKVMQYFIKFTSDPLHQMDSYDEEMLENLNKVLAADFKSKSFNQVSDLPNAGTLKIYPNPVYEVKEEKVGNNEIKQSYNGRFDLKTAMEAEINGLTSFPPIKPEAPNKMAMTQPLFKPEATNKPINPHHQSMIDNKFMIHHQQTKIDNKGMNSHHQNMADNKPRNPHHQTGSNINKSHHQNRIVNKQINPHHQHNIGNKGFNDVRSYFPMSVPPPNFFNEIYNQSGTYSCLTKEQKAFVPGNKEKNPVIGKRINVNDLFCLAFMQQPPPSAYSASVYSAVAAYPETMPPTNEDDSVEKHHEMMKQYVIQDQLKKEETLKSQNNLLAKNSAKKNKNNQNCESSNNWRKDKFNPKEGFDKPFCNVQEHQTKGRYTTIEKPDHTSFIFKTVEEERIPEDPCIGDPNMAAYDNVSMSSSKGSKTKINGGENKSTKAFKNAAPQTSSKRYKKDFRTKYYSKKNKAIETQ
uniref:ATP-dependent RNA helicase DHX36 n=1 Tax=Rhabditophanes sp. KR3021 TaxID=114890 RepID=A0AC35TQX4_9BILA